MTAGRRAAVLVTGALGPAGRSLVDQLRERRVDVVAVDLAGTGREPHPVWPVAAAGDPAYLTALARVVIRHEGRVDLMLPTVSEELTVVSDPGAATVLGTRVVVGSPTAVAVAADKLHTCEVLSAAGVPVPRYAAAGTVGDPARLLGAPYLSKPRVGRGGRGVVVHRPGDPGSPPWGRIVQEFVPGAEYAVNVYTDARTEVAVVLAKDVLAHGVVGNGVVVCPVTDPEVAAVALAGVRALGLTGPCDVDVRRRASGEPVVLEINARFGAHSARAPEVLDAVLDLYGVRARPRATAGHR